MLTGKRMFEGETVSETIASVIKDVPTHCPTRRRRSARLLTRCLERDPSARLRDIGEARIVLEDPASGEWARAIVSSDISARPPRLRMTWAFAAVQPTIAGIAIGWVVRPVTPSVDAPLRKFIVPVDNLIHGTSRTPQISPDGSEDRLLERGETLDTRSRRARFAGDRDRRDARSTPWSPDSTQIAYVPGDDRIMKVPATGGAPAVVTVLRQALGSDIGTAWTAEGLIVLTTGMPGTGLQRVSG